MPDSRLHLSFLSDAKLEQIEETAFRLLDEIGISLQHAKATEMLQGMGCRVEKGRVHIPRTVVQQALKSLTPHKTLHTPDGKEAFSFGDGAIRFHNSGGPPYIFDLDTGVRRASTMQDLADATRLLDALPNLDMQTPLFGPQDVPASMLGVMATSIMLRNTRKPISSAAAENPREVYYMVEMAATCCGGMEAFLKNPTMSISVSPVSPLTFTDKVASAIIAVAECGAPFHTLPAPCLGATGPITMAGALAQQHAECLASFVIAAAVRPGLPIVYCSRINPIDMRSAVSYWGGPEVGMAGACATQLAHRLGLPCDAYGLCSHSARLDPQYAYERMANTFMPALAGADIMSGIGGAESGLSGGFERAVIDDEMISLVKHVVKGCQVDADTLAFDVMQEVILGDGVFLSHPHTAKQMRKGVVWMPGVSERNVNSSEDPQAGVEARARAKAKEILRTHTVEPLADDVNRQIDEILVRARRELMTA